MIYGVENINWIEDTPFGWSAYSVKKMPTQLHDNMLEIIYCVRGTVSLSYDFYEVTMEEGDLISIDKDAYYIYDGKDNMCVSFYIDLTKYVDKYYYILSTLFLCEGHHENQKRADYQDLKGMLISLLKYLCDHETPDSKVVWLMTDRIVDMFVNRFDILFDSYGDPDQISAEEIGRYHAMNHYIWQHMSGSITLEDIAEEMHLTSGYLSEYLRKISLGFRKMLAYSRANASEKYLLTTDATILEISEACGFSDAKYYYKAFDEWYKCTPGEFRIKYRSHAQKSKEIVYQPTSEVRKVIDEVLVEHFLHMYMD